MYPNLRGVLSASSFAALPLASSVPVGMLSYVPNIGIAGSFWRSSGAKWVHENAILHASQVKGGIVPSLVTANAATYSQTLTTITVTSTAHNIPATTFDGLPVYLDIATGAAIAGWFTNFARVDANSFTCVSTVSQSTSGVVNTNTAERTLPDVIATVPANALGAAGLIECRLQGSYFNSGNNKTYNLKFGGTVFSTSIVNTTVFVSLIGGFRNKTVSTQAAATSGNSSGLSGSTSTQILFSVDSTLSKDITASLQCAAASEYAAIQAVQVWLTNN